MVTGVETAGLVLAAIPLIISALEHYEDLIEPTKAFIHWRRHLTKLILELYTIHASYEQAISLMLAPFADLADQTTMMEDPLSKLWTEGDVADNLREKLGIVYRPFILTIKDVGHILVEIASCLNIPGSKQIIANQTLLPVVLSNSPIANTRSHRKNFDFGQAVKFTMKKRHVKATLENLEACTERIDKWAARADILEDKIPQSRLKLKFSASLGTIKENATKVYGAISRNWCKDKPVHVARLLLQQRLVRPKKGRTPPQGGGSSPVVQATCFGLSLHGDCCTSSQWLNSEIKIDEPPSSSTRTVRVTISDPQIDYDPTNLQHITNFCRIIKQPTRLSVGFCLDDTGCLRLYSSSNPPDEHIPHALTLESLLPHFNDRPPIIDTYGLATTLVASILQLSRTPWLDTKWSKKNVLFSRASHNLSVAVDLKYPFLAKDFYRPGSQPSYDTVVNRDCSNLLALALMLLEINSGQPLEQRRADDQIVNILPNDQSDLQLADGWLKEEKSRGRISCAFSQAILTCLQEFLNPDANFDDDRYCDVFKEKVLLPLVEEMEILLHGPPK